MNIFQIFRMAIKSMTSNKGRTFLTMLGVIIGVATFITLVALGQGTQKSINDSIQSMGTNLISINITGRNSNRNVTLEQLTDFADKNSDSIQAIAPTVSGSAKVKYGSKTWDSNLIGTNADYEIVKNIHVQSGRFISDIDVDYRQKVIILGTAVVNNLFSTSEDPLDKKVKINGELYKVIGILEQKASGANYSADDQVLLPLTSAQRLVRSGVIRNFSVSAATPETVNTAMTKIQEFLLKIYNDDSLYRVLSQSDMLSKVDSIVGTMTTFLGFIAAISLFVGGIGIMNIMLVSVTERTREIGIRKAIGAKRKHIMMQFLIESTVISCVGGLIGISIGFMLVNIIPKFTTTKPIMTVGSIALSFTVSAVVGIFFGMYPANKASKLNPIEALRFE